MSDRSVAAPPGDMTHRVANVPRYDAMPGAARQASVGG